MNGLMPLLSEGRLLHAGLDVGDIVLIIFGIIWVISNILSKFAKKNQQDAPPDEEEQANLQEVFEEMKRRLEEIRRQKEGGGAPSAAPTPAAPRRQTNVGRREEEAWDEERGFRDEEFRRRDEEARIPDEEASFGDEEAWQETPAPVSSAVYRRLDTITGRLQGATRRFAGLSRAIDAVASLRGLTAPIADHLAPRAQAALADAESLKAKLAGLHADERAGRLDALERASEELAAVAGRLGDAVAQRGRGEADQLAGHVDALYGQLAGGFTSLPRRLVGATPLVVEGPPDAAATAGFASAGVLFGAIPSGLRREPNVLVGLGQALGQAIIAVAPGLDRELRASLGVPAQGRLPADSAALYESDLAGLLASWLPTLVADGVAAIVLGPTALEALGALPTPANVPEATHRIAIVGSSPGPVPPTVLRLAAMRATLRNLGGLKTETGQRWGRWLDRHPDVDRVITPIAGGGEAGVPLEPMYAFMERTARAIVNQPLSALGRRSLRAVLHPAWSPQASDRAESAADKLARRQVPRVPARELIAAALHARATGEAGGPRLVETVLGGDPVARAQADAYVLRPDVPLGAAPAPGELDLRPTPGLLADAIAFQAIFDD